ESQLATKGSRQSQVVQKSSDCKNLPIMRNLLLSRETHRKEPGSHDMIEQIRLGAPARMLDRACDERSIGYENTCHQARCGGTTVFLHRIHLLTPELGCVRSCAISE